MTSPPFGLSVAPTKNDDSSLARNATAAATSSGRPSRPSGVRSRVAAPSRSLSAREVEVLQLMARGASNREIATTLVISLGTVKSHLNHIMGKLQAHNRTEAIAHARELGWLPT